jgi:iron(III) transport system ATP-binding protein
VDRTSGTLDVDALRLEHVSHAFGEVLAVDDLTLAVGSGELVCLLGPSGCGKTTVLRIAAGLEALQQGRVLMDDKPVADDKVAVPPEQRGVGLVFQYFALFPHLSVVDNVAFGLRGLSARDRSGRSLEVLHQVGMGRGVGQGVGA